MRVIVFSNDFLFVADRQRSYKTNATYHSFKGKGFWHLNGGFYKRVGFILTRTTLTMIVATGHELDNLYHLTNILAMPIFYRKHMPLQFITES